MVGGRPRRPRPLPLPLPLPRPDTAISVSTEPMEGMVRGVMLDVELEPRPLPLPLPLPVPAPPREPLPRPLPLPLPLPVGWVGVAAAAARAALGGRNIPMLSGKKGGIMAARPSGNSPRWPMCLRLGGMEARNSACFSARALWDSARALSTSVWLAPATWLWLELADVAVELGRSSFLEGTGDGESLRLFFGIERSRMPSSLEVKLGGETALWLVIPLADRFSSRDLCLSGSEESRVPELISELALSDNVRTFYKE